MPGPWDWDERFADLQLEYADCDLCGLRRGRTNVVFGEGSIDEGSIMIIGEAPGAQEDQHGVPFVGNSGKFLDEMLLFHGSSDRLRALQEDYREDRDLDYNALREALIEDERIFYTNVVCCRPADNRDPNRQELSACWDRLRRTIYIIDPVLIITLGKVPMKWLTKKYSSITKDHGRLKELTIEGELGPIRYPLFPLLHPSFILREGDHDSEDSWARITDQELETAFDFVDLARNKLLGEPVPRRD